jgi:hypothetical protein
MVPETKKMGQCVGDEVDQLLEALLVQHRLCVVPVKFLFLLANVLIVTGE